MSDEKLLEDIGQYKYGFHDSEESYVFKAKRGLSREVVEQISAVHPRTAVEIHRRRRTGVRESGGRSTRTARQSQEAGCEQGCGEWDESVTAGENSRVAVHNGLGFALTDWVRFSRVLFTFSDQRKSSIFPRSLKI